MGLEEGAGPGFPAQQGANRQSAGTVRSCQAGVLAVYASPCGVGAVLAHRDKDGHERLVSCASRRLPAVDQCYCQLDKEGVARMFGVKRFHQYLWGWMFEAVTEHKALLGLQNLTRQFPRRPHLERYEPAELFMLEHAYPVVLSKSAVSQATSHDPVLSQVVKAVSRVEELVQQAYSHKATELSLQQGCILWGSRVVIRQSLRSRVLQLLHVGHTGVKETNIVARSYVSGPGLDKDIAHTMQSCRFARSISGPPVMWKSPLVVPTETLFPPACGFSGALEGPLLPRDGACLFGVVGGSTCYHSIGRRDHCGIATGFLCPGVAAIVSVNPLAFASTQYLAWLTEKRIRRKMVPPYHPASNGAGERVVQTIKHKVKKS
ncbi:uncharacterized protein LOC142578398 [Dermacentor variabilis]|uniref:uncharacterized protein LOC142578398 n=1 Tax=Dermacentor variabilis TaxID=34621 RepID=UPI003F5B55C4